MNEMNVTLKMNQMNLGTYFCKMALWIVSVLYKHLKNGAQVLPSVVFRADVVSASSPVVERKTNTPQGRSSCNECDALMRHTHRPRPYCQMNDVEVGQNAPHAVDLRIVAIDLRDDEENPPQEDGGRQARHQRVRLDICLLEAIDTAYVVQDSVRKLIELVDEWLYSFGILATLLDGFERWESHDGCCF